MNNIDFLDTQDNFNQTMCQAQAVVIALSGDDQFRYMNPDHVAGLLLLTLQQLEQLNTSYKNVLAAVKTEVFNGKY
jgi:hypothetical protein